MSEQIIVNQQKQNVVPASLFHKVMLLFHLPHVWPTWAMAVAMFLLVMSVGGIWHLLGASFALALTVAGLQLVFFFADTAVLLILPYKQISFGPWKAQFFPLAFLRTVATALTAFIGLLFGWPWALLLVVLGQLLGTAVLIWGAVIEPQRLSMTRLRLTSDRLPSGTPPMRIMHISDIHIERLTAREDEILRHIESSRPDIIVLTGDYVNLSYNQDKETYQQVRSFLRRLSAPYGVYATLGTPPVDLREWVTPLFEGLPITLLREKWEKVDLGKGRQLVLMGLDCTHDIPTDAASLKRITTAAPANAPQLLLYHSPELMPQASTAGIDLYLCGHTHGGQVRLPFIGPLLTSSQLGRRYVMGLYRNGRTNLYVSRGVGLEGLSAPRVRFMAPPEITLVTMRPA